MLTATYLIGKHLKISSNGSPMEEPCVLCGAEPDGDLMGLERKSVLSDGFMDCDYLRSGNTICIYCAACLGYGHARTEFIKNWSSLATDEGLLILKREDIWQHLMGPPTHSPFVFCVTTSHKKHMSFKARVNFPGRRYWVQTENMGVPVDLDAIQCLVETMQSWYTICSDKSTEPTWFTKADILSGGANFNRIEAYGFARYLRENESIGAYRTTALLELLTYALNKRKGQEHD